MGSIMRYMKIHTYTCVCVCVCMMCVCMNIYVCVYALDLIVLFLNFLQ